MEENNYEIFALGNQVHFVAPWSPNVQHIQEEILKRYGYRLFVHELRVTPGDAVIDVDHPQMVAVRNDRGEVIPGEFSGGWFTKQVPLFAPGDEVTLTAPKDPFGMAWLHGFLVKWGTRFYVRTVRPPTPEEMVEGASHPQVITLESIWGGKPTSFFSGNFLRKIASHPELAEKWVLAAEIVSRMMPITEYASEISKDLSEKARLEEIRSLENKDIDWLRSYAKQIGVPDELIGRAEATAIEVSADEAAERDDPPGFASFR